VLAGLIDGYVLGDREHVLFDRDSSINNH